MVHIFSYPRLKIAQSLTDQSAKIGGMQFSVNDSFIAFADTAGAKQSAILHGIHESTRI